MFKDNPGIYPIISFAHLGSDKYFFHLSHFAEKSIFLSLLKNAQMQGAQNPEK